MRAVVSAASRSQLLVLLDDIGATPVRVVRVS
jgi:hypothetical protein